MTKFSSFLFVLLLMLASFTVNAQEYPRGDANLDGTVNISDVTSLINYLLTGSWSDEPVLPPDTHEWVDLGLPSGTLWATCNLGANAPEDYGDYFAWGETVPKDFFADWGTYKWCHGSNTTMTKYCTDSYYGYNGFVDNKTELDPEDDAAYVNWGPMWRMPTKEQQDELWEKCTWTWTMQNGVNGALVSGPNGNTLFLPAAGSRWLTLDHGGSSGRYWSRTLSPYHDYYAWDLSFDSESWGGCGTCSRNAGLPVRAVRVSQN